jgi:hypothetical protein
MNPNTVEKQLIELERQYWQAMQDRNVEAAVKLTEFPCIVASGSGTMRVERPVFEKMMRESTYRIRNVELDPTAQVRMLTDDVGIVAYKLKEEVTVDGKKLTVEATDASTWVRRDGTWRCALHTESIKGDPWGRDRLPAPANA